MYREEDEDACPEKSQIFYCVVAPQCATCARCFFKKIAAYVLKYALIHGMLQVVRSICGDLAEDVSKVYHSRKKTITKKILKFSASIMLLLM